MFFHPSLYEFLIYFIKLTRKRAYFVDNFIKESALIKRIVIVRIKVPYAGGVR
jgi:hypothetical protein